MNAHDVPIDEITLRDYLAAQALPAVITAMGLAGRDAHAASAAAYAAADAMLKTRARCDEHEADWS